MTFAEEGEQELIKNSEDLGPGCHTDHNSDCTVTSWCIASSPQAPRQGDGPAHQCGGLFSVYWLGILPWLFYYRNLLDLFSVCYGVLGITTLPTRAETLQLLCSVAGLKCTHTLPERNAGPARVDLPIFRLSP